MRTLIIFMLLTACTAPEREAPYSTTKVPVAEAGGFECDATAAQYGVGKKTSVPLAQELMAKSGTSILRWIPLGTAVTMDYNSVRLNISYDNNMVIDRITCG